MIYPVDTTKKFALYNRATKEIVSKNIDWPRPDGGEVVGLDENLVYLEYVETPRPEEKEGVVFAKSDNVQLAQERVVSSWKEEKVVKSSAEILQDSVSAGFKVEPEGFVLGLREDDQNAFVRLITLLSVAGAPDSMDTQISDKDGKLWNVTVGRLKQIIVQYGMYFQALWTNSKK